MAPSTSMTEDHITTETNICYSEKIIARPSKWVLLKCWFGFHRWALGTNKCWNCGCSKT